ncbi:hypothetical protein CUZ56_00247 [Saezia sanguinis]|uniref:Uncharacterized protein n=1 Tax=Saezia sanguinis TaxID=1965230 RepID=A0A433SGD3_9BURK|nr:DUF3577 domain-containing protein [Saezia sanguinis]RUS67770.1 hypothetical protein CUZ56_00247 [Saezia sanguinis]
MNRRSNSNSSEQPKKRNHWVTAGIAAMAYLQDFKEITKGDSTFMVCDLKVLENTSKGRFYHRFSCYVIGEEAQNLLWNLEQDLDEKREILMGVLMRGMTPSIFEHQKGDRTGEYDVSFQSNLMYIDWIRVDKEEIYKVRPEDREDDQRLSIPQYSDNRRNDNDSGHGRGDDQHYEEEPREPRQGQASRRSSGTQVSRSSSRNSRGSSSNRRRN